MGSGRARAWSGEAGSMAEEKGGEGVHLSRNMGQGCPSRVIHGSRSCIRSSHGLWPCIQSVLV